MEIQRPTSAQNPLISIVTPCFNAQKYIAETIHSVQNQSLEDWELLLVDDASTDQTKDIILGFQEQDPRIKYYRLKHNRGAAHARNIGIKNARGNYLAFIDADDLWLPDFLKKCLAQNQSFVFTSAVRVDEKLKPILEPFIVPQKVCYSDILKSNSIICSTVFININQLGKRYMPLMRKRQDMGLWLQYLKKIDFAYGIQEPLAIYRIRKNSLSRNKLDVVKYQWQLYREVENISVLKSLYLMLCWSYLGYVKYKK